MPKFLTSAFNQSIAQFLKWRFKRIQRMQSEPHLLQNQLLTKLISSMQTTEFGKKHRFSLIKNLSQFQDAVSVGDYEEFKPFIHRMMKGEPNVLVNGQVKWFSKSSGTTSDKSKYIPVPRENLYGCHIKGSWDTVTLLYNQNPSIRLFAGKSLVMGGSIQPMHDLSPKCRSGDISAIMIHHMPSVGKPFYAPDTTIALISDWKEKIIRTADYLMKERDLVMFGGVPTWNLVLFRKLLEMTGADHLLQLFPNLKAYLHGGVGFQPYREEFKKLIPSSDFLYMEVYNASEGYFAASDIPSNDDMMLLVDNGIFYEFIEVQDFHKGIHRAVPLEGVHTGRHYVMVISSSSGLWRYIPGDTVIFTNDKPYRIKITGRTKQFINAFGEEVIVENTDKALAKTCADFGVTALEYTVAPIYLSSKEKGVHQWLIEFENAPVDLEAFSRKLDQNIQMLNSDYEAKRSGSLALDCLKIIPLKKGTFLSWLASKGKLGGQNKIPRLSNNRDIVDEILHFHQQETI